MKVKTGQLLVGRTTESGPNQVYAVKSYSELKSGDRKAWLVRWEPQAEGDGLVEEASVRFPDGEIADPWRILDLYDAPAILDRTAVALRLYGGVSPSNLTEAALKVMQALFRGPQVQERTPVAH